MMVSSASLKGKILINWCFFCRNRGVVKFFRQKMVYNNFYDNFSILRICSGVFAA